MTSLVAAPLSTSSRSHVPTIAVIGGGFSGAVTAANLLRGASGPLDVLLFEPAAELGRGSAFATRDHAHLLNVPAYRMGAWADKPGHFLDWVAARQGPTDPHAFLPRALFASYVEDVLREAVTDAPPHARLRRRRTLVTRITGGDSSESFSILSDEGVDRADEVVLAIGHSAPNIPDGLRAISQSSRRVIANPWTPDALADVQPGERILIVGTGLTMVDVALSLRQRKCAAVVSVSRHGLLPRLHRPEVKASADTRWLETLEHLGAKELCRAVRRRIRLGDRQGHDWRSTIEELRPSLPKIWRSLPVNERVRFLRRLQPFWEVHRHRCPPATFHEIQGLRDSGWLSVRRGLVLNAEDGPNGLDVAIRSADGSLTREHVDRMILCTGPQADVTRWRHPLLDSLLADGRIVADPLGLGVSTTGEGQAISKHPARRQLWVVGALRKAEQWESTAVPELRTQAAAVAANLLDRVAAPVTPDRSFEPTTLRRS